MSFSTNRLSRLSLNVHTRCGWSLWAFHTRPTIDLSMPNSAARVRVLQCVARVRVLQCMARVRVLQCVAFLGVV